MSKSERGQSSMKYVWQAQLLFHQTFECALRLPKRWTFYVSERMVDHVEQALHHAKSANSIYVNPPARGCPHLVGFRTA